MSSHVKKPGSAVIRPSQKRGHETQARLVAATLELLREQNFERLTVADITGRAGVAVGSFYRRFTSKEALLPLLYREYEQIFSRWMGGFDADEPEHDDPAADGLDRLVDRLVSFFETHRGLIRALHINSRLNDRIVPDTSGQARRASYAKLAGALGMDPGDPKAEVAANAIMLILIATVSEAILYPELSPAIIADLSREDLIASLKKAVRAQLA